MDEDIATRVNALRLGADDIFGAGVVQAEREVKRALWIAAVDREVTFGGFSIAFHLLVTTGRKSQRDVRLKDRCAIGRRSQTTGRFLDDYVIDPLNHRGQLWRGGGWTIAAPENRQPPNREDHESAAQQGSQTHLLQITEGVLHPAAGLFDTAKLGGEVKALERLAP